MKKIVNIGGEGANPKSIEINSFSDMACSGNPVFVLVGFGSAAGMLHMGQNTSSLTTHKHTYKMHTHTYKYTYA